MLQVTFINSFSLVVWSIIMCKWTTNPIIQCYFQTISIKNSFLSQNNMNPQFQIKNLYIIVIKLWYKELYQSLQWLQMSQHLNVSGHEQVQCSLQSLIFWFVLPCLLVIKFFYYLSRFFFIKCPFLKRPKRMWEIWVHFQKTYKQTYDRAYCTDLNSHICLTDHTHLQKTKYMLCHS